MADLKFVGIILCLSIEPKTLTDKAHNSIFSFTIPSFRFSVSHNTAQLYVMTHDFISLPLILLGRPPLPAHSQSEQKSLVNLPRSLLHGRSYD